MDGPIPAKKLACFYFVLNNFIDKNAHHNDESNKDQGNSHVAFFNLFPFVNIGGEPVEHLNSQTDTKRKASNNSLVYFIIML